MSRRSLSRRLSAVRAALIDPRVARLENLPERQRRIISRWESATSDRRAKIIAAGVEPYADQLENPDAWPALPADVSSAWLGRCVPVLTTDMPIAVIVEAYGDFANGTDL